MIVQIEPNQPWFKRASITICLFPFDLHHPLPPHCSSVHPTNILSIGAMLCCAGLATLITTTAASSMWWLHITGSSQPIFSGEYLFLRHLLLICYIIQILFVSSAGELGCSLCWWCAWVRVSTFTPVFSGQSSGGSSIERLAWVRMSCLAPRLMEELGCSLAAKTAVGAVGLLVTINKFRSERRCYLSGLINSFWGSGGGPAPKELSNTLVCQRRPDASIIQTYRRRRSVSVPSDY